MSDKSLTDFGYQTVSHSEKKFLVNEVFTSVATKYDVMNDFMSCFLHRKWKKLVVKECKIKAGDKILDLASGTGDLAILLAQAMTSSSKLVISDINPSMLAIAKQKLFNKGIVKNINFVVADGAKLPFENNLFDLVTISFGLRNITHKEQALSQMYRVLKPRGKLIILEFSAVNATRLEQIYSYYSFNIIPKIGKCVAGDEKSYKYLVESIRQHPNQDTLKNMILAAGFSVCSYTNLLAGVVAIHRAEKI